MAKKRKLRTLMHTRDPEEAPAVVICVGTRCCPRSESRAIADEARAYAAAHHPEVHVEVVGCLDVCKQGPIAATYPEIRFKKHVGKKRVRKLVDKLAR